MIKLSPSSLNLFRECPRCFWLHFNKDIKRPAGIFPSLPSGMDKILKEHFDKHRENGSVPHELGDIDAKLFTNMELLNVWRNNFKGLQYEENGFLLKGAVDELLEKDGKLIILDFKTRGFPLKEDTHEHYQNQLNLYTFLLKKNGQKTENYAYLLFYHPDCFNGHCQVLLKSDLIKMNVSAEAGGQFFRDAVACLEGECPEAGDECEWCRYLEERGRRG